MGRKRKQGFSKFCRIFLMQPVGHIIGLRRVIRFKQLQPTRFEDLLVLRQKKPL
jgi:hypothetical protein